MLQRHDILSLAATGARPPLLGAADPARAVVKASGFTAEE